MFVLTIKKNNNKETVLRNMTKTQFKKVKCASKSKTGTILRLNKKNLDDEA